MISEADLALVGPPVGTGRGAASRLSVEIPADPNDPYYIAQQNVHLVAEISKSNPYVGEGVYVEYKLYVSQNISVNDYSVTEPPQYNGFWNQDIKINGLSARQGTYNGEPYRYVVLKKAYFQGGISIAYSLLLQYLIIL